MVSGNRDIKARARELQRLNGDVPYTVALAAAEAEEAVIDCGEMNGVKMQLALSGDLYPYRSMDLPVFAQIQLPGVGGAEGLKVYAFDYGAKSGHFFADGNRETSWVHPCYYPDNSNIEQRADHLITLPQFQALVEADRIAMQFYSEDLEQKQDGMTYDALQNLTAGELLQLVRQTVSAS